MTPAPDFDEVQSLYFELLERWNARDAAGMAGLVDPAGYFIGFDGSELIGPIQIEETLSEIFADHQTPPYVAKVKSLRFLSDNVAIIRAVAGMVPPGKKDLDPALNAIQTLVAEQTIGQWRVAVFQNTPAAFDGQPELSEQLTKELRKEMSKVGPLRSSEQCVD